MKAWAQDHEASKGSAEQLLHFGAGELKKREASKRTFLCSRLSGSWRPNPCQVLPSSEGWRQQGASQKVTLCPRQAQVNGYKDIQLYLRPLLPLSPLMPPWHPYPAQTGSWAYAWGTWRWVLDFDRKFSVRALLQQVGQPEGTTPHHGPGRWPVPAPSQPSQHLGSWKRQRPTEADLTAQGRALSLSICVARSGQRAAGLRLTDPAPGGPQAQPPQRLRRRCSTGLAVDPAC